ncbi:hypothetical protein [Kordiimonas sp. SCSIO 12610]|uniref:hypothetical protein n=1 Tax=Kordiimonas sp. SCSIO 12610 TaxID=2829597 RepID=UPI00210A4C17|nr:hypothetical protein [Kordiimonas sp. SCSIO 12610]UTW56069.1 hypothetical protein KFF44_04020 [Kordiimonas sp. SCSIO 12610]
MAEEQHVIAREQNGRVVVTIDGYELQDMFSDVFAEQFDLDVEYFTEEGDFPNEKYILTFKEGTVFEKVQEAITSVDMLEIERVGKIGKESPWKEAIRPKVFDRETVRVLAVCGAMIAAGIGYLAYKIL